MTRRSSLACALVAPFAAACFVACQQTLVLDDLASDGGLLGTGGRGSPGSGGSGGSGPSDASIDGRCFGNQPPIGAVSDQPVVLVVLDRSSEMTGTQFGSDNEFSEAVTDLSAQVGSYASNGQHLNRRTIDFAYLEFPESGAGCTTPGCCASDGVITDYQGFINATMTCDATTNSCGPSMNHPVAAALSKAHDFFDYGPGAVPTVERYVLLVTDEAPTGNCSSSENDCQAAEDQAYALASSLTVTTVVVRVGTSMNSSGCLQNLADVQPAGPPPYYGDTTLYYNAPMAEDLQTTIATKVIPAIAAGACRFTLTTTPNAPSTLTVSQGMSLVPPDSKNGWTYGTDSVTGAPRLILHGSACNSFLLSQFGGLTVQDGCVPDHPSQTP